MNIENVIRLFAGSLVLASVILARFVNPHWLWLAVFVGLNLIQSAFTHVCPAETIFRRLGFGKEGGKCCS